MPTFFIENFGCRATEADAVALRHAMQADGWTRTPEHDAAEPPRVGLIDTREHEHDGDELRRRKDATDEEPIVLGATAYGGERPDVAAIFGERFTRSGYSLTVDALTAGFNRPSA